MPQYLPPPSVLSEIEARQDEALALLDDLERRIERALAVFTAASQPSARPDVLPLVRPEQPSAPAIKVA